MSGGSEADRNRPQAGPAVFPGEGRDRSASISSRGGRAITAIHWAPWPSAATCGGASSSRTILIEGHHISPCYAYRDRRDGESEEEYGRRVADELETKILELGAENVIGFIAEPVVGATMGTVPSVPGYFRRIREICDTHGILLILDEVMCGMGRTGTPVRQRAGRRATGYRRHRQGVGRRLPCRSAPPWPRSEIFEAIVQGSGFFQHGFTYIGHATACAAGLAVQNIIRDDNLLANVKRPRRGTGPGPARPVRQPPPCRRYPRARDCSGQSNWLPTAAPKEPFDPSLKLHARIKKAAMAEGMCCYPMGGCIDGQLRRSRAVGAAVHLGQRRHRRHRRALGQGGRDGPGGDQVGRLSGNTGWPGLAPGHDVEERDTA